MLSQGFNCGEIVNNVCKIGIGIKIIVLYQMNIVQTDWE